MRYLYTSVLVLMSLILAAQDVVKDKISPRLQEAIAERSSEDLDVFVVLEHQLDIYSLMDSFEMNNVPVRERAVTINKRLRTLAAMTQPGLLEDISKLGIQNSEPFWVVNSIYFSGTREQIYHLTFNDRIKYIDLNAALVIDDAEEAVSGNNTSSAGTREIGLEVVKAPEMWARGYTGYGTKAFVMDTGVDPDHPALSRNYAGHVVPDDQAWFGFRNGLNRPYDCQNHGSHVTGTILGVDRRKQDTIGVAYNAMWMGAPILLVCGGNTAIRMAGFQWALDPDDNPETTEDMPDVINNSWTDTNVDLCYEVYTQLFTVLEAAGVAVVFAAGNDGPGVSTISAPKNINVSLVNTFAVGAVNANNLNIADFSSRGPSACGGEGSLLIKPEVSAPGVGVRSCVPGNEYASFNGTSMAAPHVAGAILLLKEAFPQLSGVELKLALYFSAVDLGEPGEDNVFGMGMIDVDAAFNYLMNEGHQPSNPVKNYDLALSEWNYSIDYCSGELSISMELRNEGREVIDTFLIEIFPGEDAVVPLYSFEVLQPVESGEVTVFDVNLIVEEEGILQWMIKTSIKNRIDERPLNNTVKMFVNYIAVEGWELDIDQGEISKDLCGGTNIILSNQDSMNTLVWYKDETTTEPIFEGNNFLVNLPLEDSLITLYTGLRRNRLILTPDTGSSLQEFTALTRSGVLVRTHQDVRLNSFEFEVVQRSLFNVAIVNEANTIIWTSNRFYDAGINRLNPDLVLSENQTYTVYIAGNRPVKAAFYDSSENLKIAGYMDIAGVLDNNEFSETLFSPISNLDFTFEVPCSRQSVFLNVKASEIIPEARFVVEGDPDFIVGKNIHFLNETLGGTEHFWSFGDGSISTEYSPSHTYSEPGEYTVILKAVSDNDCTDFYLKTLVVEPDMSVSVNESRERGTIYLYPNPAQNEINIVWSENINVERIEMLNTGGSLIFENKIFPMQSGVGINLSRLSIASGVYMIRFTLIDGSTEYRRIIVL